MIEQKKLCVNMINMKKIKAICMFIGLLFAAADVFAAPPEYKAVDGDSLEQGERRIRLDGIDAPEFVQICYDADNREYPCGLDSLQYLENLLKNAEVRCDCLEDKDKYNREICECFADGVSLNKTMIFAGYAVAYRSNKYDKEEQSAKEHKRGIWRGKFMRPALYRALERMQNKDAAER